MVKALRASIRVMSLAASGAMERPGRHLARGIGERVSRDRPIAVVHARSRGAAEEAAAALRRAISVGDEPVSAVLALPVLRRMGFASAT